MLSAVNPHSANLFFELHYKQQEMENIIRKEREINVYISKNIIDVRSEELRAL